MKYHAIPASIIVKPIDEPIACPCATLIAIADEESDPFVAVTQRGADHDGIVVEGQEWPLIRNAIQDMLNVTQGLSAEKLA